MKKKLANCAFHRIGNIAQSFPLLRQKPLRFHRSIDVRNTVLVKAEIYKSVNTSFKIILAIVNYRRNLVKVIDYDHKIGYLYKATRNVCSFALVLDVLQVITRAGHLKCSLSSTCYVSNPRMLVALSLK